MSTEPERDKPRLSDKDREMCEYFAKSGAYYFGFEPTGQRGIDLILGAVCAAGKGHHHTESWGDEDMCSCDAGSYVDLIQAAAAEARDQQKELAEALKNLLDHGIPHLLEHWREPDKPNGVSAWKEWYESEKEARAALAKAYGEES